MTRDDSAHSETRRSILSHLATVHFNLKEYQLALDAGENSFRAKNVPSKASIICNIKRLFRKAMLSMVGIPR